MSYIQISLPTNEAAGWGALIIDARKNT